MANAALFVLALFAVLPGGDSTKPPRLESHGRCFTGTCETADDVEGDETFETVSLLQTSFVVSTRESSAAHQGPTNTSRGKESPDIDGQMQVDYGLNLTNSQGMNLKKEPGYDDSAVKITHLTLATQKLRLAWIWSPFLIAAAVCTSMRQRSSTSDAQQSGGTSALTGLRLFLGLWVLLEHAGLHQVAGSGAFVVLSGAVLSTSRRVSPGVSSSPIDSLSSCFRFLFLRLVRILPLYWFFMLVVNSISLDKGPVDYFGHIHKSIVQSLINNPLQILLIASVPHMDHCWFVQTVALIYVFYPVLERVALGPKSLQPAHTSRLYSLFGMCCLAKIATVTMMVLYLDQLGNSTWYTWKGWSLYGNPILRLPEFMLGMLVPHLAAPEGKSTFMAWAPMCTDFLFILMVIMAVVLPQTKESLLMCNMNLEAPLLALVMWGLCFGPQPSWLGRLFSVPCVVTAGEWGYGIYLFHPHVLQMMGCWGYEFEPQYRWGLLTSQFNGLPAAVAITFAMAWSTFVLIERPIGQHARWILSKALPSK